MQEIIFQLEDESNNIQYYCVVDCNKLYVLPSKVLERRVFWNEFRDYELKHGKISRVNYYKDNVLSRLLGLSKKNQRSFNMDSDVGISKFDYFATGGICLSIQKIYQEGLDYTCDFVACSTDTLSLFNFYNIIKNKVLIWGTSPHHLRGRCLIYDLIKDLKYDFFCSVDYVSRRKDYMYISDKEVYNKYLDYLTVWCSIHNEELFVRIGDLEKESKD